jgi:hypothetical protein
MMTQEMMTPHIFTDMMMKAKPMKAVAAQPVGVATGINNV